MYRPPPAAVVPEQHDRTQCNSTPEDGSPISLTPVDQSCPDTPLMPCVGHAVTGAQETFGAAPPAQYVPMGQMSSIPPLQKKPGAAEQGGGGGAVGDTVCPEHKAGSAKSMQNRNKREVERSRARALQLRSMPSDEVLGAAIAPASHAISAL